MLADSFDFSMNAGGAVKELKLGSSFKNSLLKFIATHLLQWKNHEHPSVEANEKSLTSGLSSYLTSRARLADGWDSIQFRNEVPDENYKGRTVDIAPSPCAALIWIEERRLSDQDIIFPIECKRLPTPKEKDRDEREYVISGTSSTGGIQRFKAGHHASAHNFAAMIGYIQSDSFTNWGNRINHWIDELVVAQTVGWDSSDRIVPISSSDGAEVSAFVSNHARTSGLPIIELHHLWIKL
ncbi:hypothetical protein HUU62_02250 [Rhodoferax sp. 4810]|nr:hypothetical protein [Rhodoferax jenense]